MRLFLDTGFFIAVVVPADPFHDRANAILRSIEDGRWASVHTSDFILAETLSFLRRKVRRREPERIVLALAFGKPGAPPIVTDVPRVGSGRFAETVERYERLFERGLSFTDCSTIVLMEELGVGHLATFDRGFDGLVEVVRG